MTVAQPESSDSAFPARCVECGAALVSALVCLGCPELRAPQGEFDHFLRLGLPRRFEIDRADLERRYLLLARGLHPDQFARRSPEERALAEQLSAQLNESYQILRDPVHRAEYLLLLEGGPTRESDKRTPAAFLVEMLELNEQVEEAKNALDEAARDRLWKLRAGLARRSADIALGLGPAFQRLEAAPPDARAAEAQAIREQLNVSAYLQGLVTQIGELLLR